MHQIQKSCQKFPLKPDLPEVTECWPCQSWCIRVMFLYVEFLKVNFTAISAVKPHSKLLTYLSHFRVKLALRTWKYQEIDQTSAKKSRQGKLTSYFGIMSI